MIRLEHVSKRYGDTVAVDDLSFEVEPGQVCVLIGPSGCGKTTTLRMINRLTEPTSGRIFVNGQDNARPRPEQIRRYIGYAIQDVGLFPHMTVAANIAVVPRLLHWDGTRIAARVRELLALVGLDPARYGEKYPSQLSGGEAQRVGVARALAADPPVLLMDEPFGAVDPLTRERLQSEFARIQSALKKTVILVTHDLDEAIRLADRIAVMKAGRLVQYDSPEAILARPADRFVNDFVGTDRALKRLSRVTVKSFVKPAPSVKETLSLDEVRAAMRSYHWMWAVDGEGRPVGWINRANLAEATSVSEAIIRGNMTEIALADTATLREALSRMLGQGVKYIPVVDGSGRLAGEVALRDIEAATAESEA